MPSYLSSLFKSLIHLPKIRREVTEGRLLIDEIEKKREILRQELLSVQEINRHELFSKLGVDRQELFSRLGVDRHELFSQIGVDRHELFSQLGIDRREIFSRIEVIREELFQSLNRSIRGLSLEMDSSLPEAVLFTHTKNRLAHKLYLDYDLAPQHSAAQILIVCTHGPTVNHAGGLRLLDIIHKIKNKTPHTYVEVFTSRNKALYGSLGELLRIADEVVFSENYDFSIEAYLRRTPKLRHFDVIDFQFPQPPATVESYRQLGRKLIFTPMESHIRNECLSRNLETLPVAELKSTEALEESEIIRVVDQTVCVSKGDAASIASCVDANIIAMETGVSEIEFSGSHQPIDPKSDAVCFVAYFGSQTNRDALLWYLQNIHPKILAAISTYEFRIIGRGNVSDILAELPPGVKYIGEVERIAPHIAACSIGIAPALSGSGFRGKINQYALLSKPSVASPLAADGLGYTHGQSIMVASQPEDFANCIISLLKDQSACKKMGEEAKRICQTLHGWDSKWSAIADIYGLPSDSDVMTMPSVHAVIPSYRHAAFIEERIRSVFSQEYPNLRVTVIDDASPDDSDSVIRALQKEFDFTYIRREVNSGTPFSAWEYAAQNTKEDLIWICESDDSCTPDLVSKLVRHLVRRRNAGIAYCGSLLVDEHGEEIGTTENYFFDVFDTRRWDKPFTTDGQNELKRFQRFGMTVPNMSSALIATEVFRRAMTPSILKYKLAGDWLFMGQAMQSCDVVYTPELLNRFRHHRNTARTTTAEVKALVEHISVRLILSELAGVSEFQKVMAIKADLQTLMGNRELIQEVCEEARKLGHDNVEKFLATHLKNRSPSFDVSRAMRTKIPNPCRAALKLEPDLTL